MLGISSKLIQVYKPCPTSSLISAVKPKPTINTFRSLSLKSGVKSTPTINTSRIYQNPVRPLRLPWQQRQLHTASALFQMETPAVHVDSECVHVQLGDNRESLPVLWLRDNCRCSECFHPISKARLLLLKDLKEKARLRQAKVENDDKLVLTWHDGHTSEFPVTWLKQRVFTAATRAREDSALRVEERQWRADTMQDQIPSVDYHNVMHEDTEHLRWLLSMEQDGLCLVTNAPSRTGVMHDICNRVFYPKKTVYGESFRVENKQDPSNVAYTSAALGLHTDLPQTNYVPGVQLLHCIKQANQGGENLFADGFRVALDMRSEHPEHFRVLCETPVDFIDEGVEGGVDFHMKSRHRTIEFDEQGDIRRVNYNNQVRDSVLCVNPADATRFYNALLCYESMLNDDKYCVRYALRPGRAGTILVGPPLSCKVPARLAGTKLPVQLISDKSTLNDGTYFVRYALRPGDIVCFHNYRVLHARTAFTMSGDDERLLEGGYLDWDEIRSTRRVLQARLNES